ncbi:MAG: hypothetical protein R3C11_02155 [Planctomycetaceae bacterium]
MNSPFMREQAELTAKRVLSQDFSQETARLDWIYQQALGRLPSEKWKQHKLFSIWSRSRGSQMRLMMS